MTPQPVWTTDDDDPPAIDHPDNTGRGCAIIAFGTLCFWGVVLAICIVYFAGWWRINQINYFHREHPTQQP